MGKIRTNGARRGATTQEVMLRIVSQMMACSVISDTKQENQTGDSLIVG